MSKLNFLDIKNNKQCNKKVKKLYTEAFPENERVPFSFLKLLARKNKAEFCGIYDKDTFVGLVYNIHYKDIVYVFYLATEKNLRGQGYGSKILEYIKEEYNQHRIILMVEEIDKKSDNYKERIKRKDFYYNNGFKDFNYKVKELNVIYEMLGYSKENKEVSCKEYKELMRYYWGKILYKYVYEKINKIGTEIAH